MITESDTRLGVFFICIRLPPTLPGGLHQVQHCTWLGEPESAASGGSRAAGERPGADTAEP